jgi:hypothetical protein
MNDEMMEGNQRDQPWNDSPADSDAPASFEEPAPAEVVGDDGDEVDQATPAIPDPWARETLDQRLAEEEPDQPAALAEDPGVQLVDPQRGGGDVEIGADDVSDRPGDAGDLPAEESAVHLRDDG